MDAVLDRPTVFWTAEVTATSGGAVAIFRTVEDLDSLAVVATAPRHVSRAPEAAEHFARLDAAYAHLTPEPREDRGGLPGEINPI